MEPDRRPKRYYAPWTGHIDMYKRNCSCTSRLADIYTSGICQQFYIDNPVTMMVPYILVTAEGCCLHHK